MQEVAARKFAGIAVSAANTRFVAAKQELLKNFDNHLVTRELQAGEKSPNISHTLSKGNLFSYIGFYESDDPTADLRNVFEEMEMDEDPEVEFTPRMVLFVFNVPVPSEDEIMEATPYPDEWDIGSWALDVERAISGIQNYVYSLRFNEASREKSRSGTGLQDPRRELPGTFRPISYISELLKQFSRKF